ncbi:hypothetical protein D3C72_2576720 [compost metagenome]
MYFAAVNLAPARILGRTEASIRKEESAARCPQLAAASDSKMVLATSAKSSKRVGNTSLRR